MFFICRVARLFAQEATELFEVNMTIVVGIVLLELALVLARVHLNLKSAQCIEATFLGERIFFALLIEGLATVEHLSNGVFTDFSHFLPIFFELFAVV